MMEVTMGNGMGSTFYCKREKKKYELQIKWNNIAKLKKLFS